MGDWSILITLSTLSRPVILVCFPGIVRARFNSFANVLYKISLTRELFPDPDTPVTQVITPSGNETSIFFRLFSLAPYTFSQSVGFLRTSGTGIFKRPLRYAPVTDFSFFISSSAVPTATTSPPCSPAAGPISTMQSAARIVSSSCSTTIKEFPRSRRCFNVFSSLSLSLWCSPILGSSKI